MATILPGSPPAFNKNDVESTVKALCAYIRNLHETLDYTLGQFEKELTAIKTAGAARDARITNLQNSLASALQLMNEQYTELNTRVTALEAKQDTNT